MSKEAMKLALEALETIAGAMPFPVGKSAITALRQALANEALDKKAENARELGLDYEPAQQEPWPEEPAGHKAGGVQLSGTSKSKAITELYALFGAPHNADINLTGLNMLLDALIASPPPQRTWVGLVWGELPEDGHDHDFLRGAVWAEAKLKEKNT